MKKLFVFGMRHKHQMVALIGNNIPVAVAMAMTKLEKWNIKSDVGTTGGMQFNGSEIPKNVHTTPTLPCFSAHMPNNKHRMEQGRTLDGSRTISGTSSNTEKLAFQGIQVQ